MNGFKILSLKINVEAHPYLLLTFNEILFFQVLCSVFAGVYNEYIIKGAGADIHIMIQNVFMYLDSIFCNVALLSVKVDIKL